MKKNDEGFASLLVFFSQIFIGIKLPHQCITCAGTLGKYREHYNAAISKVSIEGAGTTTK
jgi:hypothetical protein